MVRLIQIHIVCHHRVVSLVPENSPGVSSDDGATFEGCCKSSCKVKWSVNHPKNQPESETCGLVSPSHRWSCRICHLTPGNIRQRRSTQPFPAPLCKSGRNHRSCSHKAREQLQRHRKHCEQQDSAHLEYITSVFLKFKMLFVSN